MLAPPKDKSEAQPAGRDPVSLVVGVTLVCLGGAGILAIFSGPLQALLAR
jgi:hypothetical protein